MKVAIVGSRSLYIDNLEKYLPADISEIVSGGARGIDSCAKSYSLNTGIKLTEFLPDYAKYGKGAPLKRNLQIVKYADCVIAFWDGKSKGTKFVIDECRKQNKSIEVVIIN